MENQEDTYVGCMTSQMADWNPANVVKGSTTDKCSVCSINVSISPSTKNFIEKNSKAKLICMPCMEKGAIGEKVEFAGAVPGALQEAIKHLKK